MNTISLRDFDARVKASERIYIVPESGCNMQVSKAEAKQWARRSLEMSKGLRSFHPYVNLAGDIMEIGASGSERFSMEVVP